MNPVAAHIAIVAAVSNDQVLASNLMRSPDIARGGIPVFAEPGHATAGQAYNAGLQRTDADYVIFAHQDVYLPAGWLERLMQAIALAEQRRPAWAVLGVWGVREDGQLAGRVWCSGGDCEHAGLGGLQPVASMDEIIIVLNNRHGLRFDAGLPGFHLYATDLILQARRRGFQAYVIEAPVVHNSRCNPQPLDAAYWAAYRYMQRKWAKALPLKTCVVDVTRWGWPLYRQWARNEIARRRGRVRARPPRPDPEAIAVRLGYESDDVVGVE